jgi:hypothetical protein
MSTLKFMTTVSDCPLLAGAAPPGVEGVARWMTCCCCDGRRPLQRVRAIAREKPNASACATLTGLGYEFNGVPEVGESFD